MNYDLIGTGTAAMCAPSWRRTAGWRRRSAPLSAHPHGLWRRNANASTFVVERKQPELANSVMPSWVRFLRDDACEYF